MTLAFLLLTACNHPTEPEPSPVPAPATKSAQIFLAAASQDLPGAQPIGCEEAMVPVDVTVPVGSPKEELEATLAALFEAADREGLTNAARGVFAAQVSQEGDALVVNLVGEPTFAGICGVPRLKEPLAATVAPFGAKLTLNGSERDWRCLGNESGECE